MANNIAVSITADVADLLVKRAQMSAALKAASKDLRTYAEEAARTGSTDALQTGMLAAAVAAEKVRTAIAGVNAELKSLAGAPKPDGGMFSQMSAGIESIGKAREAMMAFGEMMLAAFAVERVADWVSKMGEAAEKTAHLAETFGMTVPQVQQLDGVAKATGISLDTIVRGMGILDKNMVASAGSSNLAGRALAAVGIAANDSRTQMQLMEAVADKFAAMADGPTKVALAMALFGKSGKDLIPVLNLGAAGIEEINRKTEEYGGINAAAVTKGMALAESVNESKLAMQGISNVLTDTFAPALKDATDGMNELIKSFIESYKEAGTVAVVIATISGTISGLEAAVKSLWDIWLTVWDAVKELIDSVVGHISDGLGKKVPAAIDIATAFFNSFKDVVISAKAAIIMGIDLIVGAVEFLVGALRLLGTIAQDVFTLNWGAIASDWQTGMNNLARIVQETAEKVKKSAAEMNAAMAAAMHGVAFVGDDKYDSHALDQVMHKGAYADNKDASFDPNLSKGAKGKKGGGGKEKDTVVQDLEAELEKQKFDYSIRQEAQGTYQQWSLQSDADFWAAALKRTDLNEKDRREIEKKSYAARMAVLKEKQAAETEDAKQSAALATESAKLDGELAKMALQDKLAAITEARSAGKISAAEEIREKAVVNQQILDLESKQEIALYNIRLKELQDEQAILGESKAYYQKIADAITLLKQQHADAEVLINRKKVQAEITDEQKLADQQRGIWNQAFQGFSQNIAKMITMQQGLAATFKGIWQSLQNVFAQAIDNMLRNFLVGLVTQEVAQKASNQKTVLSDAYAAARGAYKALVGIPIVGPILAPIAAGVAFAAVEAFSAEGGYDVPAMGGPGVDGKGGQLGIFHPREMILPADIATPLRTMIQSGTGVSAPGGAPSFAPSGTANDTGDTHVHFHGAIIQGPRDLERWAKTNRGAFGAGVKQYARMGGR